MIIDVSEWNGSIDWKKVKAAGVEGAIIRCGIGKTKDDKKFQTNIKGAISAGVKVGMYLFSYAKDEAGAKAEATHAVRLAEPFKNDLYFPIFIDCEEPSTAKYSKITATAFCKAVEAAGFKAGIYASSSWWKSYLSGVNSWTKWVAQWGSKKPSGADIWQYSESGKVSGISTNVDLDKNISYNPDKPTGSCYMFDVTTVKKGTKGADTLLCQEILYAKGYKGKDGKPLKLDGDCGDNTIYAINSFQTDMREIGIECGTNGKNDGSCGQTCWKYLLGT